MSSLSREIFLHEMDGRVYKLKLPSHDLIAERIYFVSDIDRNTYVKFSRDGHDLYSAINSDSKIRVPESIDCVQIDIVFRCSSDKLIDAWELLKKLVCQDSELKEIRIREDSDVARSYHHCINKKRLNLNINHVTQNRERINFTLCYKPKMWDRDTIIILNDVHEEKTASLMDINKKPPTLQLSNFKESADFAIFCHGTHKMWIDRIISKKVKYKVSRVSGYDDGITDIPIDKFYIGFFCNGTMVTSFWEEILSFLHDKELICIYVRDDHNHISYKFEKSGTPCPMLGNNITLCFLYHSMAWERNIKAELFNRHIIPFEEVSFFPTLEAPSEECSQEHISKNCEDYSSSE